MLNNNPMTILPEEHRPVHAFYMLFLDDCLWLILPFSTVTPNRIGIFIHNYLFVFPFYSS